MGISRRRAGILLLVIASMCFMSHWSARAAQDGAKAPAKKDVVDQKAIRALIAELGDDSFETRVAAQKRLADIGMPALELLQKAVEESPDLEVRERAAQVLQGLEQLLFRAALKDKAWGDSLDPDGDCLFRLMRGKLSIKIPGKPHRLAAEVGATNAPRMVHAV